MSLLTKRSKGLGNSYSSGYNRYELIEKLGAIEYKALECITEICDSVCKHREQVDDQQDLDDQCAICPLNHIREMIE